MKKKPQHIVLKLERVSVEAKVKEDRRGGGRGGDDRLGAIKQRTDCVYQYVIKMLVLRNGLWPSMFNQNFSAKLSHCADSRREHRLNSNVCEW